MKSYLSLIPISARMHRRENRLTRLCIVFAVFMVTAVFSMAEMGVRMERDRLVQKHGAVDIKSVLDSAMGQTLFVTAGVLFCLILAAGVLMISGSMNSSVAKRTQFFGMMRCIGMSRAQIRRFVRLEALSWCRTAVPAGLALGTVATWGLCAVLRYAVGGEFSGISLFGLSGAGLVSGVCVGVVTVLVAAHAPAKRAARVSPVEAVSGHGADSGAVRRGVRMRAAPVEVALGIHHASSGRKGLLLMTGSFALSIVLFLCFSVLIDFAGYLLPQSAADSDIDIASGDGACGIPVQLAQTLEGMEGVLQVYGRRNRADVPATLDGADIPGGAVELVSFDDFDLACLKKDGMLLPGSDLASVYGDSENVLATWDPTCAWTRGGQVAIGGETLKIAGLLRCDPFSPDGMTGGRLTLITSGETFIRLTGESGYSLLMLKLASDASEADVQAVFDAVGGAFRVSDKREQRTEGTYLAFVACVYAFLSVVACVSVLNIVNSISMSVTARTRQYAIMRAVGMEGRQLVRMIMAEAFTYAVCGIAVGCGAGLALSRQLYGFLITQHFPYALWRLPAGALSVIGIAVFAAALFAAWAPARRVCRDSVTRALQEA